MTYAIRNISLRLWATALVAVPFCFYIMPRASHFFPGTGPVLISFLMVVFWYAVIGSLFHFAGRKTIEKLIQEAEVWERAAILNKAQEKYLQAVRIYDSFLLSPVAAGKIKSMITKSLARFSLISGREDKIFRQAVLVHLTLDPMDEPLVELWLKRVCKNRTASMPEQDLLTCLANIHYANPRLMPLLTNIFLDLGRMDFAARQLFARVLEDPKLQKTYEQDIQTLLGEPAQPPGHAPLPSFQAGENEPDPVIDHKRIWDPYQALSTGIRKLAHYARTIPASGLGVIRLYPGRFMAGIKHQTRWWFYVKTSVIVILCLWLVGFIYNTVSHLLAPELVTQTEIVIEKSVPKPFTIQVAAYLKDTHADHYSKMLKQKNIDARIKKTSGGGKTWYLIQVSEFENKAAAAAYGNKLKSQQIIEDFFVRNK
jgi:hypothetical protein